MKDRTVLALKGLAIIGVVYHHVASRRFDPQLDAWTNAITLVFHWCVLAFLCVSGYLQALSDSRKKRTFLEFTQGRVMRLLVPFVLLVIFYSAIWQFLQAIHVPNIAVKIPPTFIGKLEAALWPVDSQVAEQLYFFPLLFGIAIILGAAQRLIGIAGTWAAAVLAGIPGLLYFPEEFTGFRLGVLVWGIAFYALGYLLFYYRDRKTASRVALIVATLILVTADGAWGGIRSIPLWLLAEGTLFRIDRVPLLVKLGDASGTIYAYHTPFLVRTLVMTALLLHGLVLQFIAINIDVWISIGLCYLLFEGLKNTRAKVLLM